MTRKHQLCRGLLCIGLAVVIGSPAMAGWGSFGGSNGSSSFGSGGGSSFGSGGGGSYGSVFGGSGGSGGESHGGGLFKGLFSHHGSHGGKLFGGLKSGSSFGGSTGASSGGASSGGSSFGSTGSSFGSTGSSSFGGGSSGGSSGGSGLFHGGLINKIRAHHQKKMAWLRSLGNGSSGGGSTGFGSSGGGHSGGSSGGSSYSMSTPVYSTPVESYPVETGYPVESSSYPVDNSYPVESGVVPMDSSYPVEGAVEGVIQSYPLGEANNDNAALFVALPEDAKLFVNGHETTSEGANRKFVSKGLKSGYRYPYMVKAVMNIGGKDVVRTKEVQLKAGHGIDLAFDFSEELAAQAKIKTSLTVRVPADAKVELAGVKTNAKGAQRKFSTSKLSKGQAWEDYRVVVTLDVAGQKITKEQTISLLGGENRVLTFDFDQQVASR